MDPTRQRGITLRQPKKKSNEQLWKKMKSVTLFHHGNAFYRFLLLFCDSLTSLDLRKIPYLEDNNNFNIDGFEKDLYDYVDRFK